MVELFVHHKDLGLVSDVFNQSVVDKLPEGKKWQYGHVRYSTTGAPKEGKCTTNSNKICKKET